MSPRKQRPGGATTPVDRPVAGPVALASGGGNVYLAYQLATGEVYVTMASAGQTFPARMSLVSGQGGLPAAATAMGPAIAFVSGEDRVIVAYATADGNSIAIASSDANLSTGWMRIVLLPLETAQLLPGLALVWAEAPAGILILYAAVSDGGARKVVWSSANSGWMGLASVTRNGAPLNPPLLAGVSACFAPQTGAILMGFNVPNQSELFVQSSNHPGFTDFEVEPEPPVDTRNPPAMTVEPASGDWWIFVKMMGGSAAYLIFTEGGWQPPVPFTGFSSGPLAAAWLDMTVYVAGVTRRQLVFETIALG